MIFICILENVFFGYASLRVTAFFGYKKIKIHGDQLKELNIQTMVSYYNLINIIKKTLYRLFEYVLMKN